jgi:sugar transferase (PEP-CTERM/EpsH1 system associated)
MRLLVLSPLVPDAPSDGDRLRLFHFMRELSRRHELTLACFTDPARPQDRDDASLAKITQAVHRVPMPRSLQWINAVTRYASSAPTNVAAYASSEMRALTDRLLSEGEFDALLCYRLRMVPYALRAYLPRVLDCTDSMTRYFERRSVQASGLRRRLWKREAEKIAAYESWSAGQFDAAFMNSGGDASALRSMAPGAKVVTAANGVDHRFLKPGRIRRDPNRLVFVGHLAYPPNAEAVRWFALEILPRIRQKRPGATLVVVGGGAPAQLKAMQGSPGLEFHGFVADFRPLLWGAGLSVCPVRLAAGRQNKILDAFATGTPVVATALTASGCEAEPGRHLLCADSAADFAAQALRLMQSPALGRRLAGQALALVRRRYDWASSARLIEAALKKGQP